MDTSPHKSDFVNANGIRLHYLDWGGSGPALVFLSGMGSNAHLFDGFAPRFTDTFHTLALTRRGHGESDYPEGGYDIDTLADDIRLFLDQLGIERAILVQHTNEGIELAHFAIRYPERVLKLVFLEPAYDRTAPEFKAMLANWPDIDYPEDNGVYNSLEDFIAHNNANLSANASSWCEARTEDVRHQVKIGPEGKVVYKSTEGITNAWRATMFGYAPEFAKISSPTLAIFPIRPKTYYITPFMTKEQQAQMIEDYKTYQLPWFRRCIDNFRRAVPQAKVVELPDSHTYFFITQAERVYQEMVDFLNIP